MRLLLLTGSHPRHAYVARSLSDSGMLVGLVVETREDFVPIPPSDLSPIDRDNFVRHFRERDEAEAAFFGEPAVFPKGPAHIGVSRDDLNSDRVQQLVAD